MAEKAQTKKKKAKRTISSGTMNVRSSYNNTIVTICDDGGNVISSASAGSCGFKGSRKSTAYAAQVTADKAVSRAIQTYGLRRVDAKVSGVGQGRDAALRAAANLNLEINSITDRTSLAYGGCRKKRSPRK